MVAAEGHTLRLVKVAGEREIANRGEKFKLQMGTECYFLLLTADL